MAINQNHTFEELGGVKCAVVEKNVEPGRSQFLRELLEFNGYSVVVVPSPAPKAGPKPVAAGSEGEAVEPPQPETFTVGVTDVSFNPVNAVFGRQLHTQYGHVVTLAYWRQEEAISRDDVPYYQVRGRRG